MSQKPKRTGSDRPSFASTTNRNAKSAVQGSQVEILPFCQSHRAVVFSMGLIVLTTILSYSNSLQCPFIFDDDACVPNNPTIRHLWPIWKVLSPLGQGSAVQSRPIVNLSLAINYAISGEGVWSYHALNLIAHITAALLLFAILRRTFLLPNLGKPWNDSAVPLAFAISILWAVHPLLTNAVTYVVQRTEVLAGLFYLLTLYCAIRSHESLHPRSWWIFAWLAYLLAMGSKEAAISAPLMVLLYDRIFLTGSWRETLNRRKWLYLGYAAIVAYLILHHVMAKDGKSLAPSDWQKTVDYALAQSWSLAVYLKLSFFPYPLIVDYGPPPPRTVLQLLPYLLLVGTLLIGILCTWRRRPWLSFLGIWFFAILAPSSSVIPIWSEVAAEKRMYLPLIAVITIVVVGVFVLRQRWFDHGKITPHTSQCLGGGLVALAVLAFCVMTFERNRTYSDDVALWQDAAELTSRNERAYTNLGGALSRRNLKERAIDAYRKSLEINPRYILPRVNLGVVLVETGRVQEGIEQYCTAIAIKPDSIDAYYNLGLAFMEVGQIDAAIASYEKALDLRLKKGGTPADIGNVHYNLGNAFMQKGLWNEAAKHFQETIVLEPDFAEPYSNLAMMLATSPDGLLVRNGAEAVRLAQRAVSLSKGEDPRILEALAAAFAETGRFSEALQIARKAAALARQKNDLVLMQTIEAHMALFKGGLPIRNEIETPAQSPHQSQ